MINPIVTQRDAMNKWAEEEFERARALPGFIEHQNKIVALMKKNRNRTLREAYLLVIKALAYRARIS